jgi:hypothetical protein
MPGSGLSKMNYCATEFSFKHRPISVFDQLMSIPLIWTLDNRQIQLSFSIFRHNYGYSKSMEIIIFNNLLWKIYMSSLDDHASFISDNLYLKS